jgi:AcrR family transcriptional regulator
VSPRVDAEERRSEIIQAAMRCFARSGYHRTSMDDIVAESGLSKGTLYWYFKNKQALFTAMLETFFAEMAAPLEEIASGGGTASERLRLMSNLFWQLLVQQKDLGDLMIEFWAESSRDEAFNAYFRQVFEPYLTLLAGLIEDGIQNGEFRPVNVRAAASAFAAIMDGLWFQAMIGLPLDEYVDGDTLADLTLKGLLLD